MNRVEWPILAKEMGEVAAIESASGKSPWRKKIGVFLPHAWTVTSGSSPAERRCSATKYCARCAIVARSKKD
jgi:hypothetical protein